MMLRLLATRYRVIAIATPAAAQTPDLAASRARRARPKFPA